jgi:hypothetical protein
MQPQPLAKAVGAELRAAPARLEAAAPWELPEAYKSAIAESIAGEAWLERLGLQGLLTGVTNSDVRVFRSAVERLAGMLRYAKQQGELEGRARLWIAAGAAFFAGATLAGIVTNFV